MNVLLLSHHFHPYWGGTESYVYSLAKHLNQDSYRTSIYTYGIKSPSDTKNRVLRNIIDPSNTRHEIIKSFLTGSQQVLDIIKLNTVRKKFGIVNIQGLSRGFQFYYNTSQSVSLLHGWALLEGMAKVITFHEHITENNLSSYSKEAKHCNAVICVNEDSAKLLKSKLTIPIKFIPNGVDLELFNSKKFNNKNRIESRPFKVLCPSRITQEKGIIELIDAAEIIIKKHRIENIQFVLMGDSSFSPGYSDRTFYSYIHQYIQKIGLNKKITFTKGRPFYEMPQLYSNCDIVVLPSRNEGFGLGVLEAMSMEKPVITTPVGEALRLITDGKEGYIVEKGRTVELSEAILRLYQNESLVKTMGSSGRKKVVESDFVMGKICKQVEKVYESINPLID